MTPRIHGDSPLWLHGLWLGIAWGVVEVSALGGVTHIPLVPAILEIAMSGLIWLCLAAVLERLPASLGDLGMGRRRVLIVVGLFFAVSTNLLIHPFLLAGVNLLSPTGILYAAVFTALFLIPVWIAASRIRRNSPSGVPSGLLVLAALVMGGAFAVCRIYLVNWTPGLGRVWAAMAVAILGEILVLAAVVSIKRPRAWLGKSVAALVLLALVGPAPALLRQKPPAALVPTAPNSAPPVILISLDTLRPDHLSAFGYPRQTSPHLDRFLATSRIFPRAYATAPWTLPSHASVFTGLYPRGHGAHYQPGCKPGEFPQPLDPQARTMAEHFRDRGYITAAIASNRLAVSPELAMDRGFQEVHASLRLSDRPIPLNYLRSAARIMRTRWLWRLTRSHYDAPEMTERALAWIQDHSREPFLLFLNYLDPHSPYAPPIRFIPQYRNMSQWDRMTWRFKRIPKIDTSIHAYDGEIKYLDSELGRLFGSLESIGLMDRAIIAVFSDHGEFFGELGLNGHGRDVHEAVLRGLLAVRSPGGRHAGVDSSLASLVDIPLLVEDCLAGRVPHPPGGDGPRVVGEKYLNQRDMRRAPRFQGSGRFVAVRWGDFKLIQHTTQSLFNVRKDPLEKTDISQANPLIVSRMQKYLAAWEERVSTPDANQAKRKEQLRETLRGLGYIN